jgi:lysyl-tRNA synthetase class II
MSSINRWFCGAESKTRNEMDRTHNPEFTAMEICSLQRLQLDDGIYRNLVEHCAVSVNGTSEAMVKTKLVLKHLTLA